MWKLFKFHVIFIFELFFTLFVVWPPWFIKSIRLFLSWLDFPTLEILNILNAF